MAKKLIKKLKTIFIPCQENNFKPKFLDSNFLFYYLAFLLVLRLIAVPAFIYLPKSSFFASLTKDSLIELTNQERKSLGLNPLKEDPLLSQAAFLKAQDMIDLDYFGHYSPQGKSPWDWFKVAGYQYQKAGENLAIGFLDSEEVFNAWKASPSHRANIVNSSFQDIGIAVVKGEYNGQEVTLVVQLFGTKIKPSIAANEVQAKESYEEETKEEVLPIESIENQKAVEIEEENNQENPNQTTITGQEILFGSQTITPAKNENFNENWQMKIFKFFTLNYSNLVEKIILCSLIFIIIILLLAVFMQTSIPSKKLLYKAVFFIIMFGLFILLDKEIFLQLIPHNLIIG